MICIIRIMSLMPFFLSLLTGCATNIGAPQTRDEFVAGMKSGGLFRNAEQVTVNRPVKTVVADVREYANKCLKVRVSHGVNYQHKMSAGSTTYHPKIETTRNGVTAFSVQEQYNDRAESGAPPDGIFTLAAEIREAGNNKTKVDIYYISGGKIVDPLKKWINDDKRLCPSF